MATCARVFGQFLGRAKGFFGGKDTFAASEKVPFPRAESFARPKVMVFRSAELPFHGKVMAFRGEAISFDAEDRFFGREDMTFGSEKVPFSSKKDSVPRESREHQ